MKTLTQYIKESKKSYIEDPELPHEDGKTPERIATDINGDEWIVGCYCYANGGAPEGCSSLKSLLSNYDSTGSMKDAIKSGEIEPNSIIVGAWKAEDNDKEMEDRETLAWVWGNDGICYKK